MFFAHWSNTEVSYRDMERHQIECERCKKETEHTLRYHTQKTKHYSAFSFGEGDKSISMICHGCLLETSLVKEDEKKLIERFDCEIAVMMAHELMDNEELKNAEKLLKKLLKKNSSYAPGLYAISKCLISQTKYDDAKNHIDNLDSLHPNNLEVKELYQQLK
jgi:tetratricopeptide (TPR) repeat protein